MADAPKDDKQTNQPVAGQTPEGSTEGPQPTNQQEANTVPVGQADSQQVVDTGPKAGANSEGDPNKATGTPDESVNRVTGESEPQIP